MINNWLKFNWSTNHGGFYLFKEHYIEKRLVSSRYRVEYRYGFILNNQNYHEKLPHNKNARELYFENNCKLDFNLIINIFYNLTKI